MSPILAARSPAIPQKVLSGSTLLAVVATGIGSSTTFYSYDCVDLRMAAIVCLFSVATAPLGARLTSHLDTNSIRLILGAFLLLSAPLVGAKSMVLFAPKQEERNSCSSDDGGRAGDEVRETTRGRADVGGSDGGGGGSSSGREPSQPPSSSNASSVEVSSTQMALLATGGSLAGLASGILGVGGGIIVTPFLALSTELSQQAVLGTSLIAMVPPSLSALLTHARLGNVDPRLSAGLALGCAIGSAGGSNVAVSLPSHQLEVLFALTMTALGSNTLFKALSKMKAYHR